MPNLVLRKNAFRVYISMFFFSTARGIHKPFKFRLPNLDSDKSIFVFRKINKWGIKNALKIKIWEFRPKIDLIRRLWFLSQERDKIIPMSKKNQFLDALSSDTSVHTLAVSVLRNHSAERVQNKKTIYRNLNDFYPILEDSFFFSVKTNGKKKSSDTVFLFQVWITSDFPPPECLVER